jgi:hypothetical protein
VVQKNYLCNVATYQISTRTKNIAKALGLEVKPSKVGFKKIAVYRQGVKIADIGDIRYNDYHTYRAKYGKQYAEAKRELYATRHKKNLRSGRGKLAWQLLWN